MKRRKILILIILCLSCACLAPTPILATDTVIDGGVHRTDTLIDKGAHQTNTLIIESQDVDDVIDKMSGVNKVSEKGSSGRIAKILNAVIRLIQIAGTGISVLVVTIVGIKYMWSSPSEKADMKKMAVPIITGCVLLFAATNLVAIVASLGNTLNSTK